MAARPSVLLVAGALVALGVLYLMVEWKDRSPAGMTNAPCAANGGPVTGDPADDWARLCAYRRANDQLLKDGESPDVVMIGDSITAFWTEPGEGIENRGIGGQTSAQVLLRFQQDAVALRPRIVHILVGINDVAGNKGPVAPGMFENNVRAMADIARAQGIAVILGTIPPARELDWSPDAKPARWVPALNRWIRQYAKEQGLILADYHAVLAGPDGRIREDFFRDGVHPNDKGYAAMKPVLLNAVERANGASAKTGPRQPQAGL